MLSWRLIEKIVLKFGFEVKGIINKYHFYIKRSMEISGNRLLHFYQQASSLIGNQTNQMITCFCLINESDYESICDVINGKNHSVPLNIFEQCILPILGSACFSPI